MLPLNPIQGSARVPGPLRISGRPLAQSCDVEWQHPVATALGSVLNGAAKVECAIGRYRACFHTGSQRFGSSQLIEIDAHRHRR